MPCSIAGWYKQRVALLIFAVAAAVTVATNASTIHVAEELWPNAAVRAAITAHATGVPADAAPVPIDSVEQLATLPMGWLAAPNDVAAWLKALLGWLMTIGAVSLGVPLWFDLLGKVAHLRGAGRTASGARRPHRFSREPERQAVTSLG